MATTGEYLIPVRRERVWAALTDPDVLRHCIPGCRALSRASPTTLRGTIEARIGGYGATFEGTLTQSEIDAPRACRFTVQAESDDVGAIGGTADITLEQEGDGTRLRYAASGSAGGKLAQAGAMIDAAMNAFIDRFFRTFAERTSEGPITRAEHAVEDAARDVADVARDEVEKAEVAAGRGFLGGPYVWGLIALAVLIVLLIIYR